MTYLRRQVEDIIVAPYQSTHRRFIANVGFVHAYLIADVDDIEEVAA